MINQFLNEFYELINKIFYNKISENKINILIEY